MVQDPRRFRTTIIERRSPSRRAISLLAIAKRYAKGSKLYGYNREACLTTLGSPLSITLSPVDMFMLSSEPTAGQILVDQ